MNQPKQSFNYSVIEIFEAQVQKTPSHLALNDIKNQYTYQTLNEKINQFANALKNKSVEKGDFVTILLEPSADFIICILAIVKLGAVYVPLDTLAPKTRLKDIIDDAKPKLIITNEEYQLKLSDVDVAVCPIKQLHLKSISYSSDNEACFIDPQAPVYMIYTSGSTGKPKGVIIPHQAVVNLALVENYASVQAEEVVAQFNNLAFDASTFEIWSALLNGGLLQIIPQEVRANYTELKKILKQYPLDYLLLPTGFFHQLIKSAPNTLNSAKTILFGGEQINPVLLRQFIEYRKHAKIPLTLINGYGPSEGTTFACRHIVNEQFIDNDDHLSAIGIAFKNVDTYVLDEEMNRVDEGELYISGIHLALGYHNCPDLNAEKFLNNPFNSKAPFQRLYKTGDLVKKLSTGELLYTGRVDDQVKVGGFRIHLSEVERQLLKHDAVSLAAVTVELGGGLHKMLTAYLVFSSKERMIHADELRAFLSEVLPSYMLPAKYVMVDELPLTPIGKVDKRKLDQIPHTDLSFHIDKSSSSTIEETIKTIWKHLLNRSSISVNKNLFDLGANSLLITEACSRINNELHTELEVADLLAHPTIHKLSRYIEGDIDVTLVREKHQSLSADIAIVGMSCRFPQADNVEEFWNNICEGRDCLTRFDPKEINTREAKNINFVPVKGILSDIEQFDASFFNFSPVDANITDPQQRVFLECTWEALEHAAVAPNKDPSKIISVFAGMTDSSYLQENLLKNNWFCREYDRFGQRIATSMSMLSTQTSYRLNLKGRSVNVNTACSTGLIAVDHACQDLILGHSDIAIAGASSITLPHLNGYIYQQGSILSPDGHCRPFADKANGTVFSDGVGVVVLKRLEDAIRDNDTVYAVIKARGVNNDGLNKLGFTAPSISGQASCIKEALAQAQLTADDISFIEAHGTATALGDIIEINALTSVYREQTDRKQFCSLGSVKANIGHTDVTAGIAGLIKTVLCLYHKKITPLVHFQRPNPNLALEDSPFFITKELKDWNSVKPRYAGISSFGVGGTNIHMILSDYQHKDEQSEPLLKDEILFISAKTEKALTHQVLHFHHYLNSTHQSLSNLAYTTHTGREDFQWRRFAIGKTLTEVQKQLTQKSSVFCNEEIHTSIVFMFSGQGMQYPQMAMELFDTVPRFKDYVQKGIDLAKSYLNCDLLEVIRAQDSERLKQTQFAQPALFIIEYALSRLLMDCGIKPDALIGHSIGEYVAACLAGIFSFEDGIALVCERGLLMAKASAGEMLAVECSAEDCLHYQSIASVDLALHNARNHYVFAGGIQNVACLEAHLKSTGKTYHKLTLSHAFHSRTMDSLEQAFKAIFTTITLSAPTIPLVSNVTGDWLSAADAINPDYWYRHLRHTVQLAKGIDLLLEDQHPLFLEVGFGQALCGFVKNLSDGKAFVTHTLPNHHRANSDLAQFLNAMGELWSKGVQVHLEPLYEPEQRQHISLPTYAFQKQRYWVNPDTHQSSNSAGGSFYAPVWIRQELNNELSSELKNHSWIIFKDKIGIGHELSNILSTHEVEPIIVEAGNEFIHAKPHHFIINPANPSHYIELIKILSETLHHPVIIHCWSYELAQEVFTTQKIDNYLEKSFYSLLYLSQAYLKLMGTTTQLQCRILTCGTQNILGGEALHPLNSSLVGICRVLPLEHSSLNYQLIDLASHETPLSWKPNLIDMISHVANDNKDTLIAYRNNYRWTSTYVKSETKIIKSRLSDKGVYLITGGLGGLGLALSEAIVAEVRHPILVLCSRAPCAPEKEWPNILRDDKHAEYQKIKQLQALKNKGATVLTQEIDVTNEGCVEHLFTMLYKRFGKINGLIHAAGVAGEGLVQLKTRQTAQQVFLPKIHGTYYLAKASQNLPVFDFVVLMSSIAAVTGLKGQVDYCGANACLDSFASSKLFNAKHSLSLNWNTWREIGMSVSKQRPEELNLFNLDNDISPDEGKSLFLQALSSQHTNLVISNYDIAHYQERLLKPSEESKLIENKAAREYLHLNNNYSEPQGSLEKQLAQIWQDNLCIETIGRDDDFFALGGHSLKALSLIEKINSQCKSTLSIQHLYKAPTIATLSKYLQLINNEQIIDIITPLNDIISTQPKIFFCHPVSGMVYCFNALVSNWDLSVTVYGMQDPSISAGELLYDSIHSMAEHYAAAIKRIAPQGPYYLLGYSLGGAVVYEIAHLLRQENQQVALLALIESWCVFSEQHHQPEQLIENFLSSHDSKTKDLADLSLARMQLLLKHRPTQTHQDILLFKASELYKEYQAIDDPYNGWSKYTKGTIDCKIINSNHDTIINAENSRLIIDYLKKTVF